MIRTELINGVEWLIDENNNRCSIKYWGSEEKAREALKSLVNCKDCKDCESCVNCEGCDKCEGCEGCEGCEDCEDCEDCRNCIFLSSGSEEINKDETASVDIPIIEEIHRKVYKAASKEGALDMEKWHTCETTHCRAGWVVHLAGEKGYALEKKFSTPMAASLIYKASGYDGIRLMDFFKNNETAMADMKRLAGVE